MSIQFKCEKCGKQYTVDDRYAGKSAPCKRCGEKLVIPAQSTISVTTASGPKSEGDQISCIRCGVANAPETLFCTGCGYAVPPKVPSRPRVIGGGDHAATDIARNLIIEQQTREANKACWALFTIAAAFAFLGPISIALQIMQMENENSGIVYHAKPSIYIALYSLAVAFWILFAWSLRNPLPAAIVGIGFFVMIIVINAVFDPTTIYQGLVLKIIVLTLLAQAIVSGIRLRTLSQQTPEAA